MTITAITACLGVVLTASILWIQWRTMIERRHGEVVQLHSQVLAAHRAQRQRLTIMLMHAEALRLELRRLPDSDPSKYTEIEQFPSIISGYKEIIGKTDDTIRKLELLDLAKAIRSSVLMELRGIDADTKHLDGLTRAAETSILAMLEEVRKATAGTPRLL